MTQPTTTLGGFASLQRERLRAHFDDQMFRTGYNLIIGTGVTSVLGVVFWVLAARSYDAHDVGLNAAAISAMTLISGLCSLGLPAVLVRYLPIAGRSTGRFLSRTYLVTGSLSLLFGAAAALSSNIWSPRLSFLSGGVWLVGFALATAGITIFTLEDSALTGLRKTSWIPIENSVYAAGKIVLLLAFAALLPNSGPFVSYNAPMLPAILVVNYLIFTRLVARADPNRSLAPTQVGRMAAGNYGGNVLNIVANFYIPILVANVLGAKEAAYFFVPWLISTSLQLVGLNITSSLTVEASLDMPEIAPLARRALTHTLRLVIPLAAVVALIAPIGLLAFGSDYADAGTTLLRLLVIGAVPNVFVILGVGIARIQHRGGLVAAIQGANAVLLVGLSATLLSSRGIVGVGEAWLISQVSIAAILCATTLRRLLWAPGGGVAT